MIYLYFFCLFCRSSVARATWRPQCAVISSAWIVSKTPSTRKDSVPFVGKNYSINTTIRYIYSRPNQFSSSCSSAFIDIARNIHRYYEMLRNAYLALNLSEICDALLSLTFPRNFKLWLRDPRLIIAVTFFLLGLPARTMFARFVIRFFTGECRYPAEKLRCLYHLEKYLF